MKTDELTINERLIPDEHSTNGGDPASKGDNQTTQQHKVVTKQPVTEHTLDPPNSPISCDGNTTVVDQYQAILREARANKMISPGGITDLRTRPPSPTNLCDFPYYECQNDEIFQQHTSLPLSMRTTTSLPRMKVNQTTLRDMINQTQDFDDIDKEEWIESCESYYAIADIGLAKHSFIAMKSSIDPSHLADTGVNCCMTPNLSANQALCF